MVSIHEQTRDGITVVTLDGEFDASSSQPVDRKLQGLVESGRRKLVVDLSGVPYLSSAALWVLQGAVRAARASGGDLRLAGLRGAAREVLAQTGFTSLFRVFPDVDAALADYHMGIRDEVRDGVCVVHLAGDLDAAAAPAVEKHLKGLLASEKSRLVLDFSGVGYIASAGFRVLQMVILATRARKGDLRLACLQPQVKETFDMIGFTSLFPMYSSVDAAVASYRPEAP